MILIKKCSLSRVCYKVTFNYFALSFAVTKRKLNPQKLKLNSTFEILSHKGTSIR